MIAREVFERDRVLKQAERTISVIDGQLATGQPVFRTSDGEEASADELRRVRKELRRSVKGERAMGVDGAHSADAYLPRDLILSNLQSLAAKRLNEFASSQVPGLSGEMLQSMGLGARHAVTVGAGGEGAGLDQSSIAPESATPVDAITSFSLAEHLDDALEPKATSALGDRSADLEPFVPYSEQDPGWLTIGLAIAWRDADAFFQGKRSFNAEPAAGDLGGSSRLFIFGDWGSGIDRARKVAKAIEAKVIESVSQGRDCHVIHPGDTYFAGWPWEQQWHVIDLWPATGIAGATSWALAGNHDYYSGGGGFFKTLLRDPIFEHQHSADGSPTSVFELTNRAWVVIGLDTSFRDHDLPDAEITWLRRKLDEARAQRQKVILLSHHQPWSVFTSGPNPPLWQRLQQLWAMLKSVVTGRWDRALLWKRVKPMLADCPVEAWFWGHEHRLALYKPKNRVERPRLIGNAGVPSLVTNNQYVSDESALLLDYEQAVAQAPDPSSRWCKFAFAVVDIDDSGNYAEAYFDEDGDRIPIP